MEGKSNEQICMLDYMTGTDKAKLLVIKKEKQEALVLKRTELKFAACRV